ERALELYNQQYANYIIISGGIGGLTKRLGGSKPEALVIKEYLMVHGIPSEDIITEINSTNTLENVIFGLETLKEHN
ncbi:ElyC/SanA/YdcF family protein, partial [Streptomyces caeruleatus]